MSRQGADAMYCLQVYSDAKDFDAVVQSLSNTIDIIALSDESWRWMYDCATRANFKGFSAIWPKPGFD